MEFETNRIPINGLEFDTSLDAVHFEINQEDCFIEKPVAVKGEIKLLKTDVYFKGKVEAEVRLICSRCLAQFHFKVGTELSARFISKPSGEEFEFERQILPEEIDAEFYTNSKINLTNTVRDAILLALPMIQLCKKDCNGLCSECGQNLNESQCKCAVKGETDPRFEKLKQLREKLQHKEKS